MNRSNTLFALSLITTLTSVVPAAETLKINPQASNVGFAVSNFKINTVKGRFHDVTGDIVYDKQNPTRSKVRVAIKAASIDTDNSKRDAHLKTPDFFDVAKFPQLTFENEKIVAKDGGYLMTGPLTMHGQTHPVTLWFTFKELPGGKIHIQAQGESKVDRHDFGLNYGNNFSVGRYVRIDVAVEAQ